MTLTGTGGGSSLAEAVIYDSSTHLLIASAQGAMTDGTVTLPISATLVSGDEYRIGFFGMLGYGTFFEPGNPPYLLPGNFPYIESSGLLRINSAWQIATDNFPSNPNVAVPQVSMQVDLVPEPKTLALVAVGLLLSTLFYKGHKRPSSRHEYPQIN